MRATEKIRCVGVHFPGGVAVSLVAQVAHNLGASVSAILPAGGATGDAYCDLLDKRGFVSDASESKAPREKLQFNETSTGQQYRFVLPDLL